MTATQIRLEHFENLFESKQKFEEFVAKFAEELREPHRYIMYKENIIGMTADLDNEKY